MANVFLSIGSNKGNRSVNLQTAIRDLVEKVGVLKAKSSMYESEPWGYADKNQYLNQVLWLNSELMPQDILKIALDIEANQGRVRSGKEGYEARVMDIDLLFYDDIEIQTKTLTIPHPRMHLRNFVLVPFEEIAPDFVHPKFRQKVSELRKNCNDKAQINIFEEV